MCILSRRLLSMSLPASLMTDCGGLLNRRSPGRKRCCHTDALHAGYHVCSSHGWLLSRIIELSNWFIFTRRIAEGHGGVSRDLSFGPTDQREVICELSNFSSHGESRRVSGFMSRIIELSNLFSHGRLRRFSLSRDMFFVTNLRIGLFSHGWLWRL